MSPEGVVTMRLVIWILCGAGILIVLATSGCYTVLSHPRQTDVVASGGSHYRSCADCHADAAYYHPYYHYGRSHRRWNDYYGYPWWYYDSWWWQPGGGEPRVPVETGSRHLWGSGGSAGSKGWSFVLPPTPPQQEPQRQDPGAAAQQADDGKDEKETEERHLWTPKKKGF